MRCLSDSSAGAATRTISYSPLLHNAVLALGCWNCDDPRANDLSLVERFSAQARAALENEGEHPTLSTLQGLLVLGHCYTCFNRPNLGFMYAGIAIRASRTLGLEFDCSKLVRQGEMTAYEQRCRLRTYWATFLVDKCVPCVFLSSSSTKGLTTRRSDHCRRWSTYTGSVPFLSLASSQVGFPEVVPAEDLLPWRIGRETPVSSMRSTTFLWTARLSTIEGRILTSIYAPGVDSNSSATMCEASAIQYGPSLSGSSASAPNSDSLLSLLLQSLSRGVVRIASGRAQSLSSSFDTTAQSRSPPQHAVPLSGRLPSPTLVPTGRFARDSSR